MAPPGQSSSQPLPSKELSLFKKIIKCYEQKQYRFGLKFAKAILSNPVYSEHGETLAMKGLILNCMGRLQEAHDCVKKGLLKDMNSYVCWHVYGLVQRSDKKYDEAIKAYKKALGMDKDNLQILRDLSLLQIQLRDYAGYKESRYHLLRLRPTQRVSWIGYATAYHLLEDYEKALNIINEFIQNNAPANYDFEHSELVLYQNMILRESGQLDLALIKLEENAAHIVDRVVYMEVRGEILMRLERRPEAERVWRQLIDRNPENIGYYEKLEECLWLGPDAPVEDRLALYDSLTLRHKRAAAPKRQPLYMAEGDELRRRITDWVIAGLRKGVPSLFKNLVPLYGEPEKVAIIESILLDFVKKTEDNGYRNGSLEGQNDVMESPTTALWLYLLVAQHYDRVRQTSLALKYADKALAHTPTLIETLMIKAKIYKHAGDVSEAARLMDEAQSLDTADRYINSKCAKYMLRAGLMEEAERMCAKFTRDNEPAAVTLNEMQCMWFEIESARAYRSNKQYGEALKKAHQIEQHFAMMVDDQFDFHTYCLRKMTLCSYVQLLRLEDVLRKHEYYYQAAKLAVKIYLRMVDRPQDMSPEAAMMQDGLSATEMKKLKKKLKKQQEQKEKEQQEAQKKNPAKDKGDANPAMQLDPEALVKCENPLEEAAKFVQHLHLLGCKHIQGYTLGVEVYLRKNKPLLMLKCLKAAAELDDKSPLLHIARVKFFKYLQSATLTGMAGDLAKELVKELFQHTDGKKLNEDFKQENIASLPHRLAVAECNILLDESSVASTKNWILKSLEDDKLSGRTLKLLKQLKDGIQYGRYGAWTKDEIDNVVRIGHQLYPQAQIFGGGAPQPSEKTATGAGDDHHSFE